MKNKITKKETKLATKVGKGTIIIKKEKEDWFQRLQKKAIKKLKSLDKNYSEIKSFDYNGFHITYNCRFINDDGLYDYDTIIIHYWSDDNSEGFNMFKQFDENIFIKPRK